MTTTSSVGKVGIPSGGRFTDLLPVKVMENDPALKASATAFGFKISGTATNNGIVASFLKLTFDKKNVTLNVSRGDTGASLLKQLEKKLPKGYEARILSHQG